MSQSSNKATEPPNSDQINSEVEKNLEFQNALNTFYKLKGEYEEKLNDQKRKIAKNPDFPISRLQRFEPANGKPTVNKVDKAFTEFRELIFDSKGNYRTDREYNASPGNACRFCEFYKTEHCKWGKVL